MWKPVFGAVPRYAREWWHVGVHEEHVAIVYHHPEAWTPQVTSFFVDAILNAFYLAILCHLECHGIWALFVFVIFIKSFFLMLTLAVDLSWHIHVPAPKDILAARLGKVPNFLPSKDFDICNLFTESAFECLRSIFWKFLTKSLSCSSDVW